MTFTLPNLHFATDALEPHIDARTMEIHHGKHHQTYINNLNAALEGHDDLSKMEINNLISDISSLPESIRGAVRNNGGGHANHSFFWESLSPEGGGLPDGALAEAISSTFGNLGCDERSFRKSCLPIWFRLGLANTTNDGSLSITSTPKSRFPTHGRDR